MVRFEIVQCIDVSVCFEQTFICKAALQLIHHTYEVYILNKI